MALDPLRPGDLDRLVRIMRATTIDDGFASVPAEPGEIGKRWMSKHDVSDRERLFAGRRGQR